jgi:hypothetical protein
LDRKRIESLLDAYCETVPKHVRHRVRRGYRIDRNAVELFEERPAWNDPSQWQETLIAKFRFVATKQIWQLYCMRRDLKWHLYEPFPVAGTFEILLAEVKRDPTAIFWG